MSSSVSWKGSGRIVRGISALCLVGGAFLVSSLTGNPVRAGAALQKARTAEQLPAKFSQNLRADIGEGKATGQNEPQVAVDQTGRTFIDWQSSPRAVAASSTLTGLHFKYLGNPDKATKDVGDVAWSTTTWPRVNRRSPADVRGNNGVFFGDLGTGRCGAIEIRDSTTINQGSSWRRSNASCQAAQVDRDWFAAYTPKKYRGTNAATSHTWVYAEYHDFGASMIWLARSSNGGVSWDPVQHAAIQPRSGAALTTSACNTIPSGVAVDQYGRHAGRVYVIWETGDVSQNAEGCDYTQAQAFDHIFISYSDNNGKTWTSKPVFNDPCAPKPPVPPRNRGRCQDLSELFNSLAVDKAGNVYVAYIFRDLNDTRPEYEVYVSVSHDGGNTWTAHEVTHDGSGTHYMPWLAAGGKDKVDVAYYATHKVEGVGQNNKPAAAPHDAVWNVYMSQTLDGGKTWLQSRVSHHPIYFGDICSTGIFCGIAPPSFHWGQDRILYDDFGIAVGPDGGARVAWTDARASWNSKTGCEPTGKAPVSCQTTHVEFACQKAGPGVFGESMAGCGRSARRKQ